MFKFRTLIMAVILMAVLSVTAFAATTEVTLNSYQQKQVLEMRATGQMALADSLEAMYVAQTQLAKQQAEARAELRKLAAKEKADREAVWNTAVSKLSFEECMSWTASDSTGSLVEKLSWLNNRWVERYGFKTFDEKATLEEVMDTMWKQINERREQARVRAEIDARVTAANRTLRDGLQEQIDAGARADVRLAEFIGNLNGQVTDLQNRVAALEEWQPTVDSRLEVLLNTTNEGRVNIAACMKALEYAKYNREPKAASQAARFVANAQATTTPVTFPENVTK
jgi:hypothetical protein